jgi:hypothetical protein
MRVRVWAAAACALGLVLAATASDAHGPAESRTPEAAKVTQTGGGFSGVRDGEVRQPDLRRPLKKRPLMPEPIGVRESVDKLLSHGGETVQRFHYPGAEYVKVHFSRLDLLSGDRVTVANPDGTEVYTYRTEGAGAWAMSVTGDTAVVTLESAATELTGLPMPNLDYYGAQIDQVAHGFTPDEQPPAGPGSEESTCGRDDKKPAACYRSDYPTEYAHSRPVARLLINGSSLCTAWRVGPNNRMLTNHHCFSTAVDARNTEVWFNYECATCEGPVINKVTKVMGDDVLATDQELDYTLFTVRHFHTISGFGYLELDNRKAEFREPVYVPQHPGGNPKMLAIESDTGSRGACEIDDPAYDGYFSDSDASYYCDTAPGSSGSPVLSRHTDKVIALHHFGGCPNSGVRADLLYREIGDKL